MVVAVVTLIMIDGDADNGDEAAGHDDCHNDVDDVCVGDAGVGVAVVGAAVAVVDSVLLVCVAVILCFRLYFFFASMSGFWTLQVLYLSNDSERESPRKA